MKRIFRCTLLIFTIAQFLFGSGCKKDQVPTVTTTEVSNIIATSATSGGTITDEGSGTIIVRGVCWSTGITPTLADSKTIDGAGAGSFSSNITGLKEGSVYYG